MNGRFQRLLPRDVALGPAVMPQGVLQVVGQDLAEPRCSFGVRITTKLLSFGVGIQQRLLDQIRRVHLLLKPRVKVLIFSTPASRIIATMELESIPPER